MDYFLHYDYEFFIFFFILPSVMYAFIFYGISFLQLKKYLQISHSFTPWISLAASFLLYSLVLSYRNYKAVGVWDFSLPFFIWHYMNFIPIVIVAPILYVVRKKFSSPKPIR